jgi:hypothetical protein
MTAASGDDACMPALMHYNTHWWLIIAWGWPGYLSSHMMLAIQMAPRGRKHINKGECSLQLGAGEAAQVGAA